MTVCSPILASVVAANALLLADLMRVSLLNCFHKKEAHLVEVPVIASGKGVSFSIAMAIQWCEYNTWSWKVLFWPLWLFQMDLWSSCPPSLAAGLPGKQHIWELDVSQCQRFCCHTKPAPLHTHSEELSLTLNVMTWKCLCTSHFHKAVQNELFVFSSSFPHNSCYFRSQMSWALILHVQHDQHVPWNNATTDHEQQSHITFRCLAAEEEHLLQYR